MVAYKFLRPGAVGPFSGHSWPAPAGGDAGSWVASGGRGDVCRDGVHACQARNLPLWIWEELWEVELDGDIEARPHKLRAPRGRLLRRVEAWSPQAAKDFAASCAARAARFAAGALRDNGHEDAATSFEDGRDLEAVRAHTAQLWDRLPPEARIPVGMASDGAVRAWTTAASDDPYVAANGAAVTGYIAAMTGLRVAGRPAHDRERDAQAEWLCDRLSLSA